MKKGYLVLQNGRVFEGTRFGAETDATGELVFTTGMCGYLETLTDPSYAGQIVTQTYPLIGNYGVIPEDFEGECHVRGYVVREWCQEPSNFRCQGDLDSFLKERGVPGLCGVDTRELTRILRESGVMNACICDEVPADLAAVAAYAVSGVVESVTVDMGAPVLEPASVPVQSLDPKLRLAEEETVDGRTYRITGVSMGNPHGVIFVDEIDDDLVLRQGPLLEEAPIFPAKANIEFAKVLDRSTIEMRVWERGTGETLACGTGACATAVAAALNGLTGREVDVLLRGGTLHIRWDETDGPVFMTGPVAFICDGVFYL